MHLCACGRQRVSACLCVVKLSVSDAVMTEMLRGCEGPETPPEACVPCPMSSESGEHHKPAVNDDGEELAADQEMQWDSARDDSPPQAPSGSNQFFLSPPQGLGADPFRTPSSETFRDPIELPCEEMCVKDPSEALCKSNCDDMPCEEGCREFCKGGPTRRLYEDFYEEPWPGKTRLPSIVVDPIEGDEVESGELRWPPDNFLLLEETEENEIFDEGEEEVLGAGVSSFESDLEEVLL